MSMNFIEDVQIDQNNLNNEWVKQATLYAEWSERHVEAIRQRDLLTVRATTYKSRLYNQVRNHWQSLGFSKNPTEAAIESYIGQDTEWIKFQNDIAELNYQINLFQAARQSLEHKKRAIEGLERLHLAGYYSSLTTSPEGQEIRERQMRNAQCAVLQENTRIGTN